MRGRVHGGERHSKVVGREAMNFSITSSSRGEQEGGGGGAEGRAAAAAGEKTIPGLRLTRGSINSAAVPERANGPALINTRSLACLTLSPGICIQGPILPKRAPVDWSAGWLAASLAIDSVRSFKKITPPANELQPNNDG